MNESLAKYVLLFLAAVYILSGTAETLMSKDGAHTVFEATKTLVPHIGMFVLGFYFSRKA